MRTIGVSPMASRMVSQIFFCTRCKCYTLAAHATTDRAAHRRRRRRQQAEADSKSSPAASTPATRGQRRADGVAGRLAGAGPAAGVRGDHGRPARHDARRARGRRRSTSAPDRPSSPRRASGSATARRTRTAPNTSPSACRRFRRPRSIATTSTRRAGLQARLWPENSTATSSALNGRSTSANPTRAAARPMTLAAVHPALRRSRTLVSRSALLNFCVADFITSR